LGSLGIGLKDEADLGSRPENSEFFLSAKLFWIARAFLVHRFFATGPFVLWGGKNPLCMKGAGNL
jgi:hypothetical protein